MTKSVYSQLHALKGRLSFKPLLDLWKEVSQNGHGQAAKVCYDLYQRFYSVAELLEPIIDDKVIKQHEVLIEEAMVTLFAPAFSTKKESFAIAGPFSSKPVYASLTFQNTYLDRFGNFLLPMDVQVEKNLAEAKINLAYKLILRKWYSLELIGGESFICSSPERGNNIHNYFQLEWDPQFINVSTSCTLPELPEEFLLKCYRASDITHFPLLSEILPLNNFIFEGFVITRISEVSAQETANKIRNILQHENPLENEMLIQDLRCQLRYLLNIQEGDIGFTIFYDNGEDEEMHEFNYCSILLNRIKDKNGWPNFCQQLANLLQRHSGYLFWSKSDMPDANIVEERLSEGGWKAAAFVALYGNKRIIACLEILASKDLQIGSNLLLNVGYVQEMLQFAINSYRYQVRSRVDETVKKHFTAVQSSVGWKFNKASVHFLAKKIEGSTAEMEPIIFEDVYPLYGILDIKNSSQERKRAIQQDLLQQLHYLKQELAIVSASDPGALVEQVQLNVDKYIHLIKDSLNEADIQSTEQFLQHYIPAFFEELTKGRTGVSGEVRAHFKNLGVNSLYSNTYQKRFEISVKKINDCILRNLDSEQGAAQQIYPHYFERLVTDGVEFNMYVGQSIVPKKKFSIDHLKAIRLWQLSFIAKTAQQLGRLSPKLDLPLQTTQLVLAYSKAVSLRFRSEERRFDIDGIHNAHFEIMKKRIDKVMVKHTSDRLTQPGTIAVVYSNDHDAKEYIHFMEQMKAEGILAGTIENLDLEELQGISGLRGLRAAIS
jgi:hypothetical protein